MDPVNANGHFASPPCLAGEISPDYFDPLAVDSEQARDVARWRKAERARLRIERQALSVEDRAAIGTALAKQLREVLSTHFDGTQGRVVSAYWPIKGEPDLPLLMAELHTAGVTVCLPIVEQKAVPLVFRRWTPETRMVRGDWNIPVPPPDAEVLIPDITLAPLVGWDGAGFRLGYGGGCFDRTLAALAPPPFTIGIGFQSSRLFSMYPQPHDIPLDIILTQEGVQVSGQTP